MRKLAFSLALLVACSFASAAQSNLTRAGVTPATTISDSAARSDKVDSVIDPASARLGEIEKEYYAKLMQALSDSADPRDWALASLIAGTNKELASSLTTRAAAAAPNDALVQWIALSSSDRTSSSASAEEHALDRLQNIEPDNASVWMHALMYASSRHDATAIDNAMHRMAASVRSDDHLYGVQKALIETFRRNPFPSEYFSIASAIKADPAIGILSRESAPYVASVAIVSAMAFPAYQTLLSACKPRAEFHPTAARIEDCAKIGRLMTTKGSTLIANRIGFALLRVTRTYTADDVQLARSQGWIYEKFAGLYADTGHLPAATKLIARVDDQNATGSELEAMRRELAREDLPIEPPADWVDTNSPFSAKRLRGDEAALMPDPT